MERLIEIKDFSLLRDILGAEDKNLKILEKEFEVKVSVVSQGIKIKGRESAVKRALRFIEKILKLGKEGLTFEEKEFKNYLSTIQNDEEAIKVPSAKRKFVFPKTESQRKYVKAIRKYDIVFSIGPAGTGKTYLAMAMAVNFLMEKYVRRIILTRPAIEAGESLGFLPGDMYEKLAPYLRPLYDALYDMMEAEVIEDYLETGIIEIAPLAYMRGRTLNNAFIILDEAQNCTSDQLKMFLTRLGFDSKMVITGDITQSDLPGGKPTGLLETAKILKPLKGVKFVYLGKKDVVRHLLIQKIIQAYEDFYRQQAT
ncbi:MAG TPA: phosphate starvation-inducible protein PhoH [Candidatus Omnitrophica bacterium]|nr:phosphate starvation-inducible protein PhoH [Candidatus Omnitrophota bacterium]